MMCMYMFGFVMSMYITISGCLLYRFPHILIIHKHEISYMHIPTIYPLTIYYILYIHILYTHYLHIYLHIHIYIESVLKITSSWVK